MSVPITRGKTALVSLYYDYGQKHQSPVSLIGGLYKQAVVGAMEIPEKIKSLFEESRKLDGHALRLIDMVQLFIKAIGHRNKRNNKTKYSLVQSGTQLAKKHRKLKESFERRKKDYTNRDDQRRYE